MNRKLFKARMKIRDLLIEEQNDYKLMSTDEIGQFRDAWKRKFHAENLRKGELEWYVFSFKRYNQFWEGDEADQKYKMVYVKEFVIDDGENGYKCLSDHLADLDKLKSITKDYGSLFDLFISHKNLKWTYVITHEDDAGPYFAE